MTDRQRRTQGPSIAQQKKIFFFSNQILYCCANIYKNQNLWIDLRFNFLFFCIVKREQELADKAAAGENIENDAKPAESDETTTAAEEDEKKEMSGPTWADLIKAAKEADTQSIESVDKYIRTTDKGEVIVEADHPEIQQNVDKALDDVAKQNVTVPAHEYIKVLRSELEKLRAERALLDPTALSDGGWILDNFPTESDQFNVMVENNIIPDTFLVLQDSSDDYSILTKRWYNSNRAQIDERIALRLAEEEALRLEEARRWV